MTFREVFTEPNEDGMTIQYRVEPVMSMQMYEGRILLDLVIMSRTRILSVGPIEIIENERRCTQFQTLDGFTEFENNTLGLGIQLLQEVTIKERTLLYPCQLQHNPIITVQAISDHSIEYYPICYPLSSSYYLYHIPSIRAGSYNLRLFLNGTFLTTLHCTVRSSLHMSTITQLSPQWYMNEEAIIRFTVLTSNNQPFTDVTSTEVQILVLNEGTPLDFTHSFYQDQMEIRFIPDHCSKNSTFIMICMDDCLTQSLNVGTRSLSHA